MGNFDFDEKTKRPSIIKDRNGNLVDKNLRPVNSHGWLIDKNNNIVDNRG